MLTSLRKLIIPSFSFLAILIANNICAYEIDIKADTLTYQQDSGEVTASGSVQLDWVGKILKADNIEMKIPEKQLSAEGNVTIEENDNVIFADNISYDIDKESGVMCDTLGCASSIFFRAEKMIKESSDTYTIENVIISNCDLDTPHHYIKAKEGKLIVDKKITVYKAVYYIGSMPVFYFPKYSRPIGSSGSERFSYSVEPGYSNEGGISAKGTLKYNFMNGFSTKLYLDYLGRMGEGIGIEGDYFKPDSLMATLYAYGVNDRLTDDKRWKVEPSYWQKINDLWTVQSHGEFVSDSYFNNIYQQNNWNRVLNTRRSYLAFTRQSGRSNLRIMSELYQVYDPQTNKLQEGSYLQLPQIYYSVYPKTGFLNTISSFVFNFENRYNYEYFYGNDIYDYNYVNANADYNITKDYRLTKKLTFKPVIGLREEWYDSRNPQDNQDIFVTRYYGSLNARYRLAWWMDWNLSYDAKLRTAENSLTVDSEALDKGVEANRFVFNNYMYLGSAFTMRNYTGYDFGDVHLIENLDGTMSVANYKNWYPLINEITYVPSSKFTAYIRQQQDIDPFKFNSLQLDTKIGQLERFYVNLGLFYEEFRSEEVDVIAGLGFWLNAKWRLDYLLRTTCRFTDMYWSGHDQEFRLYRDMHCFNLGTVFRVRDSYYELYFKFDMKANVPTFTKKDGTKEIEQEFYPWR